MQVSPKIYLSRQHLKKAKGEEIGELLLEKQFIKNGYVVMYPEELSLDEQIAVFNRAQSIACVNGTIPLNIIFSSSKIKLIVLNKTSIRHTNLVNICRELNKSPFYIDVYKEPIKGHPHALGKGPFWMVFNNNIKNFFEDSGMTYKLPAFYKAQLVVERLRYFYLYFKFKLLDFIKQRLKRVDLLRRMVYKYRIKF